MLTGLPSRLVGIDIDDQGGEDLVNELWQGETWEYTTGKGRRLLFRSDEKWSRLRLHGTDGRSVERLAESTNNVIPPSEHASGRLYAWTPGLTPREIPEPAELPEWAKTTTGGSDTDDVNSDEIDWVRYAMTSLGSGNRNEGLAKLAGRLMGQAPLNTKEAHMLLQLINKYYCKPTLSKEEVSMIVKSIGKKEAASSANEKKEIFKIKEDFNCSYKMAQELHRSGRSA